MAGTKLVPNTSRSAEPKRKNEFEDDCGFVFRRKTAKTEVKPEPAKKKAPEPSQHSTPRKKNVVEKDDPSMNPTPSKKQLLERQRRRSSLSGLAMAAGRRRSSLGIGFTHDEPPQNVEPAMYHKHILPDIPGPLKMKQLLIWAVQKVSKEMGSGKGSEWEELVSEPMTQGLHTNELGTSWYQRPASTTAAVYKPNPINEDMKECLGLYQRYHKQLSTELVSWKALESSHPNPPVLPAVSMDEEALTLGTRSVADLVQVCKWVHRLPFHVDRLGWLLHVYGNFEGRSKQYCEDVFRQIFDKFFASPAAAKPHHTTMAHNPIQVLKAMSMAPAEE